MSSIFKPVVPVSVVIPCYRCVLTIGRAIASVFAQSVMPSEIILVEDDSGDGTLGLLQEFERASPGLLKIVRIERNQGAASARNRAWAIATQPYIAFLDADDSWHPEKLRIQYEYMRSAPDVALCGHQCVWLRDTENPPVIPKKPDVSRIGARSLLFKNAFSTPTVMLKRDIACRFEDGKRVAEDLLLWQQVAFAGLQVVRLESPLAYLHKPLYGAGGLSAQLWKMERGELNNFVTLYQAGRIGFPICVTAMFFSLIKFMKRLLVTKSKDLAKLPLRCSGVV